MKGTLTRILTVSSVLLVAGLTACKCGSAEEKKVDNSPNALVRDYESTVSKLQKAVQVDVAKLIPIDVDLALLARRPDELYAWLQHKLWWKDLKSCPVWQDLYLSQPVARLSTMRHKLASLSPVEFKMPKLEEFLSTPLGIAVRKTPVGSSVLLVKQIDVRIQALDRLAEVFNQIDDKGKGKVKVDTIHGIKLRSLEMETKNSIHYAVFYNLLLLSNNKKMLQDSLVLATGDSSNESIADSNEYKQVGSELGKTDLEILLKPEKYALVRVLTPFQLLGFGWTQSQPEILKVAGVSDDDALKPSGLGKLDAILQQVPLDSRIVFARSGFDAEKNWKRIVHELKKKSHGNVPLALAGMNRLMKKIGKKLVLVFTDINPIKPSLVAFIELKSKEIDSSRLEKAVAHEIELMTGSEVEKIKSTQSGEQFAVWETKSGVLAPSFSVLKGWLIIASTRQALVQVLKSVSGKSPSLMDNEKVSRIMTAATGTVGMIFVNFDAVFKDLVNNSRKIISSSERFDSNDLDGTWIPFFKALSKMGSLGGSWSQGNSRIKGQVLAL